MKSLKFRSSLVDMILKGEKTVTWRLFDDKNLRPNDELSLIKWENLEEFAKAVIIGVKEKKLGELTEDDYVGHEKFTNQQDMLKHYIEYYGDRVTLDTPVKIICFKLI
jgi:hypothetical protein